MLGRLAFIPYDSVRLPRLRSTPLQVGIDEFVEDLRAARLAQQQAHELRADGNEIGAFAAERKAERLLAAARSHRERLEAEFGSNRVRALCDEAVASLDAEFDGIAA